VVAPQLVLLQEKLEWLGMDTNISVNTNSLSATSDSQKYNLTISHVHEFIWFRVAKVATNSTLDVLRCTEARNTLSSTLSTKYSELQYQNYFKFAFIRNPWDRLVSCWINKVLNNNYFGFSDSDHLQMQKFNSFVDYLEDIDVRVCDQHIRLQSRLIDLNNIDYIGRFESFEKDLKAIIKALELGVPGITKRNFSINRKAYREYYNELIMQKVAGIYFNDINIFSYQY